MQGDSLELKAGTVLAGSYQLVRELARGGMGTVWEARHLRLSAPVAVKVLHGVGEASTEAVRRFRREAEIASQLGHPNIVKALDFDSLPDGKPFLVMELLHGESLRARLDRGALELALTVEIAGQIASALHAAHHVGVVHRDLKPENIYLRAVPGQDRPHAMLLDFGISKLLSGGTTLTKEGTVFGTPQYMAPEQANTAETGPSTDQYALAAIVYEMLCGQPAVDPGPPLQVLFQVVNGHPRPLAERLPSLPPAVSAVVARAMAKAPAQRFDDVLDFVRELTSAAGISASAAAAERAGRDDDVTLPPDDLRATVAGNEPTLPSGSLRAPTPAGDAKQPSGGFAPPASTDLRARRPAARTWILIGAGGVLLLLGWGGASLLSRRQPPVQDAPPPRVQLPPRIPPRAQPPQSQPQRQPWQPAFGPPPRAVAACKDSASGSRCRFRTKTGERFKGRCWSPNRQVPLACKPEQRPR
jgi:serine/threonine-protein kinase